MRRLVWKASECVKEGITRDALARQQLQSGLLDVTNLGNVPSALPAPALARLILECTLVSDGVRHSLWSPMGSRLSSPL